MRVRGGGTGSFGSRGGGSRSSSFRKGRQVGQKARGILMKWVSDDMAWVNIEGQKLLAQLQSSPPVGAQLTFIIKQLTPDIILREVFEVSGQTASAITIASDFETSRTLFENQFRHISPKLEAVSPSSRLALFLAQLAEDAKLLATLLDTTACLTSINEHVEKIRKGTLHYSPWLAPSARRHIGFTSHTLTTTDGASMTEAIEECEFSTLGMVRTESLCKGTNTSYRIKLQSMGNLQAFKHYMRSRKPPADSGEIKCLGISKLPPDKHGGLIAEMMFSQKMTLT